MKVILDEGEALILNRVAERNGVEAERVYEIYEQIMTCNFEQDIWDIINQNEEELKGA